MIDLRQLTIGLTVGAILIVLGLVPGLFRSLVHGLDEGMRHFPSYFSPMVSASREPIRYEGQPYWLAGVGMALVIVVAAAFAS